MAEREASGEFDYLIGDLADTDVSGGSDAPSEPVAHEDADRTLPDEDRWDDPDDSFWSNERDADPDRSFDPFDARTWNFEPAPTPWYRTKPALAALIAAIAAAVALVVSTVLLVLRSPSTAVDETTTSVTPTAPTTVASTPSATDAAPPPPPPPPSTADTAESIAPAPAQTNRPNPPRNRGPEIGVTRTPVTRSPISVAPSRPGGPRQP